jgi:release factor glutamine methyltransferase
LTQTGSAPTWEDLYRLAADRLPDRREARWMVEEVSGEPFARILGRVPENARRRMEAMIERRVAGEPLQYVIGSWPFRGLELTVDRRVLIPRPETEQVVEAALAELDRMARSDSRKRATVVDLGTGSGAIALSLARERTWVDVWAVDNSTDAIAVVRANLVGLAGAAAARVRVVEGDWWSALPVGLRGTVDLVVSNPPYVSTAEMATLDPQVRDWEPAVALEAGPDGTEAIAAILEQAPAWLKADGVAVIEVAPHQGEVVQALARAAGFGWTGMAPDLAGRPRALVARR